MNYRDDRDALRSEVDTLQQELAVARADQERLQQIEQRLAAAKREIDALEAEVGKRRRTGPSPALLAIPLALVGVVVAASAAIFILMRPSPAPPPAITAPPPQAIPEPPAPPPPPRPAPLPASPEPERAPQRQATASWSATAIKSNAPGVRPGASCRVNALVVPDKSGMHVTAVKITCGAQTIYDQSGRLNGMSQLDSDAKQRAGTKPGTWIYDLSFSDVGTRSATRNQAKLDSAAKLGKIWSENLPEFRVDLAIKPGSDPVDVAVLDLDLDLDN
ncbi:MAG: hypothetical protein ABI193_20695 [Minicystis sp.]